LNYRLCCCTIVNIQARMRQRPLSRFRFLVPGIATLVVLAAAGCDSNGQSTLTIPTINSTPPSQPPTVTSVPATTPAVTFTFVPPSSPYTVSIAAREILGNYLADGRGMTLYYTVSDKPGYSNLPDETLSAWPVFYSSTVVVPPALNAADFGTYSRDPGTKQTTYRGYPLYYFFQDKAPGDAFGNKLGGVWFVVSPDSPPPQR
jgi:predicted lipoprotein with Yx(FWY)xxD motif